MTEFTHRNGPPTPSTTASPRSGSPVSEMQLEALFERHFERVFRVARRLASTDEAADTLTTRAFAAAHRAAVVDAPDPEAAEDFLLAELGRACRAHRPSAPSTGAAPLRAALQQLTPDARLLFVLVDIEGLPVPRAARVLGTSSAHADALLADARGRFEMSLAALTQQPLRTAG